MDANDFPVKKSDQNFVEFNVKVRVPKEKILTVGYQRGNNKAEYPAIRFSFNWLDSIGFKVGSKIKLTLLDDNSLLITKYEGSEEAKDEEAVNSDTGEA